MKTNKLLTLIFVLLVLVSPSIYGQDYEVDPTFTPQFDFGQINTFEFTTGGKILVGGQFSIVGGVGRAKIVRLNSDGSVDGSFTSPLRDLGVSTPDEVRSIRTLPDGKILIGGRFLSLGPNVRIARLNSDGTLDATLSTKPFFDIGTLMVRAEPLPGGKFMACGQFTAANGFPQKAVARFNSDGTVDEAFTTVFTAFDSNPSCSDIKLLPDGTVLVVGYFYWVNGIVRSGGVKLNPDGTPDSSFNIASTIGGSDIRLGQNGDFFSNWAYSFPDPNDPGGYIFRTGADRRDLISGNPLAPYNCNNYPILPVAFGQTDGRTVITGGCTSPWNNVRYLFARFNADASFDSTMDRVDFSFVGTPTTTFVDRQPDGKYIVVGRFQSVNGVPRTNIVRLRPKTIPTSHPDYDFDGDGKADFALYRPSQGMWYIHFSSGSDFYMPWGISTDKPMAADYDNDGKTDIAVYRDGDWWIVRSTDGQFERRTFGQPGFIPLVGHFSLDDPLDDRVDMVTREQAGLSETNVRWRFRNFGTTGSDVGTMQGEFITDKQIVADLDGDSIDEFGFFRNGYWKTIARGGSTGVNGSPRSIREFFWGTAGDIPVPADYDGDERADYAVFRPSTGTWWIDGSTVGPWAVHFGLPGDVPVPADYDGDGKTDIAIYRNGQWWQLLSATLTVRADIWGAAGDIPIPAQLLN